MRNGESGHFVIIGAGNFERVFKWNDCAVNFDERTVVVLCCLSRDQSDNRFGSRNFLVAVDEEQHKLRKVCILIPRKGTGVKIDFVDGEHCQRVI